MTAPLPGLAPLSPPCQEVSHASRRDHWCRECASHQCEHAHASYPDPPTVPEAGHGLPTLTGHVDAVASCSRCIANGLTGCAAACDYCGAHGCRWQNHPTARADVAAWQAEARREEFPFGDHREEE